ncbi:ABC transporter substrate-binding protein [Dongia soli]|uniref:Transporter substrate-binding domain-containing protein n=1 Tax=Dongia soli TaxID=600628 RepID=A0ABU5EJ85_9PROT|nr:ABC transporter substrate-binding protein [Dongia soli]MDY0885817.1 transporter substrate-binding domain-containing protein [Dongia soli]
MTSSFVVIAVRYILSVLLLCCLSLPARAAELPAVRVGLLQFGTVNWEVSVMRHGLDAAHGIRLVPVDFADKDAATLALMSGEVDVIVTDWLWVARQRAAHKDFTFVAFSSAVGGVVADPKQGIKSVSDLAGRKLGIGGGPDDKSWLLLQAYARKTAGLDLRQAAELQFAAPPILTELARRGRIDAVLNFWQFNAQLEAKGFDEVISIRSILPQLGLDRPPVLLGWVFRESWAVSHPKLARGLLDASFDAKEKLRRDDTQGDALWQSLRPQMKAPDEALFAALKAGYRAGMPDGYGPADIAAANAAFHLMAEIDPRAVGGLTELPPGTFWTGYRR